MKKRIFLIIILLFILLLVTLLLIRKYDFNNSISVITSDHLTKELHYYEINKWKYKRNTNEFKSDEIEIYKVDNNCYNDQTDLENHMLLNQLIIEKCKIKDNLENNIEIDGYLEKIIKLVSKKEKYSIIENTILKTNDEYYVIVELNVNLWTPYKLYKYNKEKNKLKLIYEFDGENIIGIK
jgi:hypothetical protein